MSKNGEVVPAQTAIGPIKPTYEGIIGKKTRRIGDGSNHGRQPFVNAVVKKHNITEFHCDTVSSAQAVASRAMPRSS